jgi:predicted DNA-binding transcriptional regulator AlpA
MEVLKFEQLPNLIADLKNEVKEMKTLLLSKGEYQQESNNPLFIEEVAKLTNKTVPTIYGYCQRNEIPYSKKGNRLYFFKYEIIDWLKTGKRKTIKVIRSEADSYLSNKNGVKS